MEGKSIKRWLVALFIALIVLAVPTWGIFLSGVLGESADIIKETPAPENSPTLESAANTAQSTAPQASETEETDDIQPIPEWKLTPLILFKEPQLAQVERNGREIISIMVKVTEGTEIRKPLSDIWFTNIQSKGDPGFFFSEDPTGVEKKVGVRLIALDGNIEFLYTTDEETLENGAVIGICKYSGMMKITAYELDFEKGGPAERLWKSMTDGITDPRR